MALILAEQPVLGIFHLASDLSSKVVTWRLNKEPSVPERALAYLQPWNGTGMVRKGIVLRREKGLGVDQAIGC